MCRFNKASICAAFRCSTISIHLMCRFNQRQKPKRFASNWISIHLMCRFNPQFHLGILTFMKFQYISCVGSIRLRRRVPAHRRRFQYISCVGSILEWRVQAVGKTGFQYISCVGSIRMPALGNVC